MAFMMNKLEIIKPVKLFLKNKNNFFAKNHCEIQVRTILVYTLYSIKYGINETSVKLQIPKSWSSTSD